MDGELIRMSRRIKENNERILKKIDELKAYKDLWIAFKEWNYENDRNTYRLMVMIEDRLILK